MPTVRREAREDRRGSTLTDVNGTVHTSDDRRVTVEVWGAGVLQALGTAAPATE